MENKKESVYLIVYVFERRVFGIFKQLGFGRIEVSCDSKDLTNVDDVESIENGIAENLKFKDVKVINIVKLS